MGRPPMFGNQKATGRYKGKSIMNAAKGASLADNKNTESQNDSDGECLIYVIPCYEGYFWIPLITPLNNCYVYLVFLLLRAPFYGA